jgi:transposase
MPRFLSMPQPPQQTEMLPCSLEQAVPPECDVRLLKAALDRIDWRPLEAQYAPVGRSAYPPKVLCGLLFYGYGQGIRSSRRIEQAAHFDLRYRWLAGGLTPDHATLARFRRERGAQLAGLFQATARLCAEAGLVLFQLTATDGSKLPARGSRRSLYDRQRVERERQAVAEILAEAEAADAAEEGSGAALQQQAARREGKRRRAQRLQAEQQVGNVSLTEPESRVMQTTQGLRPAYNGQLTVDSAQGVIVAAEASQQASDCGQLISQLEQVEQTLGQTPEVALADGGYSDEGTFCWLEAHGQEALIPPRGQPQEAKRQDLFCRRCFVPDADHDALLCPAGRRLTFRRIVTRRSGSHRIYTAERSCRDCSFFAACVRNHAKASRSIWVSTTAGVRERMRDRLMSALGRARYRLRQQLVERVLAHLKRNLGLVRFTVSGFAAARSEWWLICSVHNLRIWGKWWAQRLSTGSRRAFGGRVGGLRRAHLPRLVSICRLQTRPT